MKRILLELEQALQASTARANGKLAEEYANSVLSKMFEDFTKYEGYVNTSVAFEPTYYNNIKAAALIEYYAMASAVAKTGSFTSDEAYKAAKAIREAVERLNVDPTEIYNAVDNTAAYALYKTEYDQLTDAYTALYNAVATGEDATAAEAALNALLADKEFMAKVEKYCEYLAVIDAKNLIASFKFGKFSEAVEIYKDKYLNDTAAAFNGITGNDVADKFAGNATYEGYYNNYTDSKKAADELANYPIVGANTHSVEAYVSYVARVEAFEILGLHNINNYELSMEYSNITISALTSQTGYNTAKNTVANLSGLEYKRIIETYNQMIEYKELVIEAVYILAEAEGVTLEYAEGHDGDVRYIVMDNIESTIVVQAVERAWLVIGCLEDYNYIASKTETYNNVRYQGEVVKELTDGTKVCYSVDKNVYFSETVAGGKYNYVIYKQVMPFQYYYDTVIATTPERQQMAYDMFEVFSDTFEDDVKRRIEMNNREQAVEEELEEEVSRYATDNIVIVTYGKDMNTPYKSIILNYNNYAVNIEYDGKEYTIPAHEFVVVK